MWLSCKATDEKIFFFKLNQFFLHIDKPWFWLMVVKHTSTPSVRLQIDGNVLESLNTHQSCGMKYVDPNLIIYIIKTTQQPLSTELQSGSTGRSHDDARQPRHLFASFVISAHYFCAYKLPISSFSTCVLKCFGEILQNNSTKTKEIPKCVLYHVATFQSWLCSLEEFLFICSIYHTSLIYLGQSRNLSLPPFWKKHVGKLRRFLWTYINNCEPNHTIIFMCEIEPKSELPGGSFVQSITM